MSQLRIALTLIAASLVLFATDQDRSATAGRVMPAAPMLEPRSGHTATLLPSGKILIVGGMRRNQDFYRSAELYDPATARFERTGDMAVARVGHLSVLLRSGKVLIAGGWIGHEPTAAAELYDPATGKFTATGMMTHSRGDACATLLDNGDVLVTGGADHLSPSGTALAEIFHPDSGTFEAIGPMHDGRVSHTCTALRDGRVLIAGGRGDRVNRTAELYDPKTRRFVTTGTLLAARYKHTAGLLTDGRVLIAGGSDERDWNGTLKSAEIYDPATGRFTSAPALHDARFKLPELAPQITAGRLLIAGGSKQVEIYDPRTGKFLVATGQLSDAWHFMTETRLKDGRVLLAGGYANNDRATAETWIYQP